MKSDSGGTGKSLQSICSWTIKELFEGVLRRTDDSTGKPSREVEKGGFGSVRPRCLHLCGRRMAGHLETDGEEAGVASGEYLFNVLVDGEVLPGVFPT